MNPVMRAMIGGLIWALMSAPVSALEMYKWTDAQGNVHYSQAQPTDKRAVTEKVMYFDEKAEQERVQRQLELERVQLDREKAKLEEERARMSSQNPEGAAPIAESELPKRRSIERSPGQQEGAYNQPSGGISVQTIWPAPAPYPIYPAPQIPPPHSGWGGPPSHFPPPPPRTESGAVHWKR